MLTRLTRWISSFFKASIRQLALEEAKEARDCAVECIGEEEEGETTSEEEDAEREEEEREEEEGVENIPIVNEEVQDNGHVAGKVGVGRLGMGSGRQESVREVILRKKLLPFGHCPKVAFTPPLVLDTFGVTFV